MAALRPSAIAGVVLNDIGPVIEPQGLMRIKGYVGKLPQPRDYEEGAEILRRLFSAQFPKLGTCRLAGRRAPHLQSRKTAGWCRPTTSASPRRWRASISSSALPPLWKEFDALARLPLLVIRGANSDLLTPETVAAMRARRREMEVIEVPDQGHAPLLAEPDIIARIADFAARCDRAHMP